MSPGRSLRHCTALGLPEIESSKTGALKISSFGSFAVRKKGKRIGRNPKTGQEVPINPRRVLVFRASHVLKDQINASLAKTLPAKTSAG